MGVYGNIHCVCVCVCVCMCVCAVSYTHLDVYKRQPLYCLSEEQCKTDNCALMSKPDQTGVVFSWALPLLEFTGL